MKKTNNFHKRISWVMVVLLLAGCFSCLQGLASVDPTPEDDLNAHLAVTMGDVNGDSIVNAEDALLALKFSVGKIRYIPYGFGGTNGTNVPFEADLSGDGKLDATDALQMLQIAVGKREESVSFLEIEEFISTSYELEEESYVAPQIINNQTDLEQAALPLSIKTKLKTFDFSEQALLVFSDAVTVWGAPKAVQVAVHNNRALVGYEYGEPLQLGQYLLAVAVPSHLELSSFYAQPTECSRNVQPMLYTLEYEADAMIEIEYPTYEVVTTKEEALEWIVFMKQYGFTNEAMSNLLFYRAESGFFEKNQMVVWFDFGMHKLSLAKNRVRSIDVSNKAAVVMLEHSFSSGNAAERSTFRMRLLDVPKEKVAGCNEFEFKLAPAPGAPEAPVSPTDMEFSYQVYDHVGVGYVTGLYGYATGAAYIDSCTQWETYCQQITGRDFNSTKYNADYFENNSLIVFEGKRKTASPVQHTVTSVSYQGDVVTVTLSQVEETGRSYTTDVYSNFCVVELEEHLGSWLEGIRFVVNYRKEKVDGSGNLVDVLVEQTMEYTYYYDIHENQWM